MGRYSLIKGLTTKVKQPEFNQDPIEGDYERTAWYLFESFLHDELPNYLYDELALSTSNLMKPLRQYASMYLHSDQIKKLVDCEHFGKSIFVLRLIPLCSNDQQLYDKLKKMFLNIKLSTENKWQLEKKRSLSIVLPYFNQYNHDNTIRNEMLNYFENTRLEQVEKALRYLGGTDKCLDSFTETLKDEKKRSKHWVYIWFYKAICQENRFNDITKKPLKELIRKYKSKREMELDNFEKERIEEALSI